MAHQDYPNEVDGILHDAEWPRPSKRLDAVFVVFAIATLLAGLAVAGLYAAVVIFR